MLSKGKELEEEEEPLLVNNLNRQENALSRDFYVNADFAYKLENNDLGTSMILTLRRDTRHYIS